jgi:hypothetical protein
MDKTLKVEVSFQDELPKQVGSILKDVGATNVKELRQHGLTGIETVLVGILVTSSLANLVIKLQRLWKCGVVVDARGSTVLTKKDCDLPRGTVLVISPNGVESKLHEPSELQIKSLIAEVAK